MWFWTSHDINCVGTWRPRDKHRDHTRLKRATWAEYAPLATTVKRIRSYWKWQYFCPKHRPIFLFLNIKRNTRGDKSSKTNPWYTSCLGTEESVRANYLCIYVLMHYPVLFYICFIWFFFTKIIYILFCFYHFFIVFWSIFLFFFWDEGVL